jgi:DNA-binding MarR family transcriptional regulator
VAKRLELPFDPIERAAQIWGRRFGESPSMAAVTSIMRAQQILLGSLDALLRPYDLTFARYEALVLLSFSRTGALPLRVIGERLMVHPTSVTNTIDRLSRQGFVERRHHPSDGRVRLAEITPAGRAVMEKATRDLMAAEFGLGGYAPDELAEMFTLLRGLRLAAGDFLPLSGYELATADGAQVRPPSVVNQTVPSAGSAGSAKPCRKLVMPTKLKPVAGAGPVRLAARQLPPSGSTSIPSLVARMIGFAGLDVSEAATPAGGGVHFSSQFLPPSDDA